MLAKAFSVVSFAGFLALAMAWGGFWGSVAAASGDMPSWFVIVGAVGSGLIFAGLAFRDWLRGRL
jgi:hypothetical protein